MAQFSKVNGDLLPVLHLDQPDYTNSGANAVSSGLPVQPQGPKLDFFTVTGTGALTGTQVSLIIQATQQLATVYMYEYVNDTNDSIAMAVYPFGAWDTTTLDAACTNALSAGGVANSLSVTNSATFFYC
jgi:hypothetical protein